MSSTMRTALLKILEEGEFPGISSRLSPEEKWSSEDDELRTSDGEFLQTWVDDYADDRAWEKLIADANRFQKFRTFDHLYLIWYALRARRLAEDDASGIDRLHAEREKTHEELLDLAKSADTLDKFWLEEKARQAVLALGAQPFRIPIERVWELQTMNKGQAGLLRRMAAKPPPLTTFISRQRRSKERGQTREIGIFMRSMVGFVREACGKPMTTRQLLRLFHKAADAAGIREGVTLHALRHSFATHLLQRGTDIRVIQALLGHDKLDTTARYTRVATGMIAGIESPLDLLSQPRKKPRKSRKERPPA
jgi:integrase